MGVRSHELLMIAQYLTKVASSAEPSQAERYLTSMKPDRHTLQLCAQVAETLHLVLLDSKDDDLRDLMVLDVIPISGAGTLLVRVSYSVQQNGDLPRVQQKLFDSAKALRQEVAASITRRRTPELLFQVVPSHSHLVNDRKLSSKS